MGGKIKTLEEMETLREECRRKNLTVVFTNGCFDIIHTGHIRLFEKAGSLGKILIVAVNTDRSIQKLKGHLRPVFPLEERMEVLEAIAVIDYIVPFDEETPRKIISRLLPDVLIKGGDWKPGEVVGKKEVEDTGGRVVIFPFLEGHSTSELIRRIRQNDI